MRYYKHAEFKSASILIAAGNTIIGMASEHDLSTKSGRIAYIVEASGHNPAALAKQLGCAPAAVYQWIDGSTKNLKEHLLWKLADITGFEARWISLGEGPMKMPMAIKHANQVLVAMEPAALYTAVRLIDTLAEPHKSNGTQ